VTFHAGHRFDIASLGELCTQKGLYFVVDAMQSAGVVPLDAAASGASLIGAGCHKGLLVPQGVGILYCRQGLDELRPAYMAMSSLAHPPGDYVARADNMTLKPDAGRFEIGNLNLPDIHALDASLTLIESIGVSAIEAHLYDLGDRLIERIDELGIRLVGPRDRVDRSPISTCWICRWKRGSTISPAGKFAFLRSATASASHSACSTLPRTSINSCGFSPSAARCRFGRTQLREAGGDETRCRFAETGSRGPTGKAIDGSVDMSDIVILGAGVIGMTSAYALARRGHSVTVIDEGTAPATNGASFGNGAQLSYAYTDALASPGLLRNLPRFLLGRDEAFRWKPSASCIYLLWNLRFLTNCSRSAFDRNTLDILTLALESRRAFTELLARHPIDFDHRKTGKLHLHASAETLDQARRIGELKSAYGLGQSVLTTAEAIEREPALAHYCAPFAGAIWSPIDELGDPVKFCQGLRSILEVEYGVRFIFGTRIDALRRSGRRLAAIATSQGEMPTQRVVLSLGTGSVRVARSAGIRLPIWPMQGYSLTVPVGDAAPTASITDSKRKLVLCRIGERLRVAGLADLGPGEAPFERKRFAMLLRAVRQIFPRAGNYEGDRQEWTGFRPLTPNSQPLVAATMVDGLYLNCGHGALGWTLSMGSAERLAELIVSTQYVPAVLPAAA
jgi:D-amino-acid dehydrogenase